MRPPQNAGENAELGLGQLALLDASMRPPQNAGENTAGAHHVVSVEVLLQ